MKDFLLSVAPAGHRPSRSPGGVDSPWPFSSVFQPIFSGYTQIILITIGVNIILCASLNLVNGYMGSSRWAHAGFMSPRRLHVGDFHDEVAPGYPSPFPVAVVFGGLMAGAIGFLLALLSFKTRGDYLCHHYLGVSHDRENPPGTIPHLLWEVPPGCWESTNTQTFRGLSSGWSSPSLPSATWSIRNSVAAIIAIREDEIAANAMGVRA